MKIEKMTMPIYMDYSATTPVDPRVAEKMIPFITEDFGNPASRSHPYGWTAEKAVENARKEVAKLVNADPREIIWTSGATESNNLAIKGASNFYSSKGKHIITMATEHKAVIDAVREMERLGYETTFLVPEPNGLVDIEKFKRQLDFFQSKFGFIEKNDYIEAIKSKKNIKGVVLTFDDGLKDHIQFVLPELIKRKLCNDF